MATSRNIRAGGAFVEIGASDKYSAALRKASASLKKFGSSVRDVGIRMGAASAAAIAPLAASSRTFADFEQEMARVKALTGANQRDFARLTDEAKRLGEETVFTAGEAARAMGFFALAGFKVDTILKAVGPTLDLAAAGQMGIAESADIVAKIMAGMGIAVEDVGNAVDVLTKAMTTANTDLVQLGEAMKYVGPIAKSAGKGLEETVAAVQLLSNAGIQSEMAGTTLRGALLALTNPSEEAKKALRQLNVQVLDSRGNVRHLADIIDDMNKALAGMGTGQKLDVIGRIFDARQAAGFAELLSQGGDRLRQFEAALKQAGGTAERIAKTQLDTLRGDTEILKSSLEGLQIAVGEALVKTLRPATREITGVVGATTSWVKAHKGIVVALGLGGAALAVSAASMVALGTASRALGFALAGALIPLKLIGLGIKAGTAAFAVGKVAALSMVGPLGLLVGGLAAAGGAWLAFSGTGKRAAGAVSQAFGEMKETAQGTLSAMWDALASGDLTTAAGILWAGLKVAWHQGIAPLEEAWNNFRAGFLDVANSAFHGVLAGWENARNLLETGWAGAVRYLSDVWSGFTNLVSHAWESVANFLAKSWNDLRGLFDTSFNAEEANAAIEANAKKAREALDQATAEQLGANETAHRDRLTKEDARHREAMANIEREKAALQAGIDRLHSEKAAEAQKRIEGLRQRQADAEFERKQREWGKRLLEMNRRQHEATEDAKVQQQQIQSGADVAASIPAGGAARGTFNPLAAFGLGSNHFERIASASEQTAKNTKKIARAQDGALAFT